MTFHRDSWWRRWVFGFVLPWVGWEAWPTHWDGEPAMADDPDMPMPATDYEADFLTVEWLGAGITIMRADVRRKEGAA